MELTSVVMLLLSIELEFLLVGPLRTGDRRCLRSSFSSLFLQSSTALGVHFPAIV